MEAFRHQKGQNVLKGAINMIFNTITALAGLLKNMTQ